MAEALISGVDLTHADILRRHLSLAGLSQRAAASELGINERTMRSYCAGKGPVPSAIILALSQLAQIRRNAQVSALLDRGGEFLTDQEKLRLALEFVVGRTNQLEWDAAEDESLMKVPDGTTNGTRPAHR